MRGLRITLTSVITGNRWPIITISMLVCMASMLGLARLEVDSDLRVFFSKDNPQLQNLEAVENTYTKTENILMIVAPHDGDVFSRKTLHIVQELTEELWQAPDSNRVSSITNYQHTWAAGDELVVDDLVADLSKLSDADIVERRSIAISEPSLLHRLVDPMASITVIAVNIHFVDKTPNSVMAVSDYARNIHNQFSRAYPDTDFYLTGSVMFDTAFSEVGKNDMVTLVPVMLLVLVITIGLVFRTFVATFMTTIVIVMATGTAMGLAGWLGVSINPASSSAPTIILTLAVADSVHILFMMYRLMADGKTRDMALMESIRFNYQAVFLTSLTTAVGFLTMNLSDAPPFHSLGNIVAMGVTAAFFYSMFFLPALILVLPDNFSIRNYDRQGVYLERIASMVIKYKFKILLFTAVLVVLLATSAANNRLNDNWIEYFNENIPVRVATDVLEERVSGADFIEYNISSGVSQGINDPAFLKNLDSFVRWLRDHPNVEHVISITDLMKKLNKNMHADDAAWYRLPHQRGLAAQYLLLYEMSLPYGQDLNNIINVDKSATRVIITTKNLGTSALGHFDKEVQAWLRNNMPASMHSQGTGISIVWAYLSERNIINMLTASLAALVSISTILVFALKRIDIGTISLIPNIVPAAMAFGLWGLFVGEIGLGLSVVVSMTLGIVVDDSVHFITKYLRAKKSYSMSTVRAIHHAYSMVGPAMWATTVALVAGFLVLMFSDYKMSADMGLLSAITITLALVMDFLLLPVLLLVADRK